MQSQNNRFNLTAFAESTEKTLRSFGDDQQLIGKYIKDLIKTGKKQPNELLYAAACGNCTYLFQQLIQNGIHIDSVSGTNGLTALQMAFFNNDLDAARFLITNDIENKANYQIVDAQNQTLLHYATLNNNLALVKLCLSKSINIDAKSNSGLSALSIAHYDKFPEIEFELRKNGAQVKYTIPDDITIKDFQRQGKSNIVKLGPIAPLPSDTHRRTASKAICSQLYFEDDQIDKKFFQEQIDTLYKEAQIMRPLMDIMALSALGHHDIGNEQDKKFKIVAAKSKSINHLKIMMDSESEGAYSYKNTAFISTQGHSRERILGLIFHESSHFSINQAFQNSGDPFFANDHITQSKWINLAKKVYLKLSNLNLASLNSSRDREVANYCYDTLRSVFDQYSEDNWPNELAVKVGEIVGAYGYRGYCWLKNNVPELLEAYAKDINPVFLHYLDSHHYTKWLRTEKNYLTIQRQLEGYMSSETFFSILKQQKENARVLIEEMLSTPGEFQNFIPKQQDLCLLLSSVSKEQSQRILQYLIKSPEEFKRLIINKADLHLFAEFFPEHFPDFIGDNYLNNYDLLPSMDDALTMAQNYQNENKVETSENQKIFSGEHDQTFFKVMPKQGKNVEKLHDLSAPIQQQSANTRK